MSLVLAIASAGTLAGQDDGERREQRRDERHDRGGEVRSRGNDGRDNQQAPRQDAQQGRQLQAPEAQPQPSQEGGRRNNRMSVEERRALRRQIDQASHDMYPPGH